MQVLDMGAEGLTVEKIIEIRKMLSKQIENSHKKARHQKCLLCEETRGLCNSHTIPQFCLENIAWKGKLNSYHTLMDSQFLNKDSGINNAGTFHIICKTCDGQVFQNYEKEQAYETTPTEQVLNQIVLKNVLRDIYKHETEVEIFDEIKKLMQEKAPTNYWLWDLCYEIQVVAKKQEIQDCYEIFNISKSYLTLPKKWLRVISYDKLDYVCPIAFQGMVSLTTGFDDEIINNGFNHESDYKIEYLHIAIFPLQKTTAIILFIDSKNIRYAEFEKRITNMTQKERLEIINNIIFLYTEDYYLSKQLDENTIKRLQNAAKLLPDYFTENPEERIRNAVKEFDLKKNMNIPNLFLKEYSVKTNF